MGLSIVEKRGELAISAMAAKAKAEVEARFVIALNRPRNIMNSRAAILDACKRPRFAEGARYSKPVGGRSIEGFSIRFVEEAIKSLTNVNTDCAIIWEDSEKRCVRVTVTDLETNTTYGDDIVIEKTVERRQLKQGQEAISKRQNSGGEWTYLVAATEDDLSNKVASAKSKIIRNNGLRLVPQDILDEAEQQIYTTLDNGGTDPQAEKKKVADAFGGIGIRPSELEKYLGHPLDSVTKKELQELRGMFAAIRDGETKWADYLNDSTASERPAEVKTEVITPKSADPIPAKAAAPAKTSQEELSEVIVGAGFTFDQFQKWGLASGNLENEMGGFYEVPSAIANRLLKARKGMLAQLTAAKEVVS